MTGSQEPRIAVEPVRAGTDGGDAALLMEAYASPLDPWQRSVVDCWLGTDGEGRYTMTSAGLALPRQNGKNVCLEARELFGLLVAGERVLHTAHQVRTSKKSFRRLEAIFTDKRHPEIGDAVRNIRYTNGEEAIELKNGGSIEYTARSRQAARGFDGISLVVLDEAQELTDDQLEALMATLSASATGARQLIFAGTPPYPGCPGTVFRRRRVICLGDPGPRDAWHEWSAAGEHLEDMDLDDRTLWYLTNPALGIRLNEDFTAEERRTMSPDGFARERLGWWSPVIEIRDAPAIAPEAWEACRSEEKKPAGKTAYGVKFSPDGGEVVLCGAVIPEEGKARISLIERRPTGMGIGWLAEWLCVRYRDACCVVIDGRNGVDVLTEQLARTWRAKDSVIRPRSRDVIAAVSCLVDAVNTGAITWYGPQEALAASALSAVRRPIGGGWGFGGDDAAPIEACALALWGCKNSKRDPGREMRIG